MHAELAIMGGPPVIKKNDLPVPWPYWSPDALARVQSLLSGNKPFRSWPSPSIEDIEERFARLHDSTFAIYMNSGTSALMAGYFGLGCGPGDEVLVPTNTFLATVTPLYLLNLVPVLCDVDPETGNLDLDDAQNRLTARTAALAVTHIWGTPLDLDAVEKFAASHDLGLVEDCSHAHGASFRGRMVGTAADAAAFSLGAAKPVTGGVGGILLTSRRDVYERAMLLGQPVRRSRAAVTLPEHLDLVATGLGANLRGNPVSAVLVRDHLARLSELMATKNANIRALENVLAESGWLRPPVRPDHWSSGTRYGFKASYEPGALNGLSRDAVVSALRAEGVPVSGPPGPLLHRRRLFADQSALSSYSPGRPAEVVEVDPADYPNADAIQDRLVSFDATLLHAPADRLVAGIARAIDKVEAAAGELRALEAGGPRP